ncbi:MAG: hypothetical protein K2L48_04940 [Mycoplasmoidaceae bacterium]|nr:hypothetical protein [Mycoplasmoidaceae bacterium]
MDDNQYLYFVKKFVKIDPSLFPNHFDNVLLTFKPQISYAEEINGLITDTFLGGIENLSSDLVEVTKTSYFKTCVETFKNVLNEMGEITFENASEIVNKVKTNSGLKGKELYLPMRLVTIGKEHGPEMNKILTIVGKEKILSNIDKLLK